MPYPEARDYIDIPPSQPARLVVVVDVEEEFDWFKPFSRNETSVTNVNDLWRAQKIFDRHGITPTYVVDYPVATTQSSLKVIRQIADEGRCTIGTQLHPWVNPPFKEELSVYNSFPGNLPRDLEYEKLRVLSDQIEANLDCRSVIYRAGRYGFGPNTTSALERLGYEIDVSVVPFTSFSAEGGPDYSLQPPDPFWFGRHHRVLSVPLTCGFTGALSRFGETCFPLIGSATGETLKIKGAAARFNLLDRIRLSPEGMALSEMKRVTEQLLIDGQRVFQLSFHSSSLKPGCTKYVKNDFERDKFLNRLDDFLSWAKSRGLLPIDLPGLLPMVKTMEERPAEDKPITFVETHQSQPLAARYEPERLNHWRRHVIGRMSNKHIVSDKPDIFIFSSPRSGSTHLMELIGTDHSIKAYDEPLNPRKLTVRRQLNATTWEDATRLSNREGIYSDFFRKLKRNKFPELNVPFYDSAHRSQTSRIVFKVIHGGEDMIEWFEQEFDAQIVILLRHPVPTALSHKKNPRLPYLIAVDGIASHLSPRQLDFADALITGGSYFEKSILDWCLQNYLLLRDDLPSSWLRICYEDLIASPEDTVGILQSHLNLNPSTSLREALHTPSGSAIQSDSETLEILHSPDNAERLYLVNKWLDRVDEIALKQAQKILDVFEIDFYSTSSPFPKHSVKALHTSGERSAQ